MVNLIITNFLANFALCKKRNLTTQIMYPEILTLCEYASETNGKLTIVDTFDSIKASKFPWRAYFSIAAKINMEGCEKSFDRLTFNIASDDNSEKIFEASSPFERMENMQKLNVVAGLKGLIFEHPGKYCFEIFFDNQRVAKHFFKVELRNEKD